MKRTELTLGDLIIRGIDNFVVGEKQRLQSCNILEKLEEEGGNAAGTAEPDRKNNETPCNKYMLSIALQSKAMNLASRFLLAGERKKST